MCVCAPESDFTEDDDTLDLKLANLGAGTVVRADVVNVSEHTHTHARIHTHAYIYTLIHTQCRVHRHAVSVPYFIKFSFVAW